MNQPVRYGQAQSERLAEENQECRQIIKEINNFGVSERQRLLIIYFLALELDDIERMRTITTLIRDVAGKDIFVSGEMEGGSDGSTSL